MKSRNIEDRLLATHISENREFATACQLGDAKQIMDIVSSEMEEHKLFTPGSKKLRDDIFRMLQGKAKVSSYVGNQVLSFVWNSRLSGIGLAVAC